MALKRRNKVGHLAQIAKDLYVARTPAKEMKLVYDLIVEAFDLAHAEFYYTGNTRTYERFVGQLEENLREHLNHEIGDKMMLLYDVSLSINRIPCIPLLEDAKQAMSRGHFLTPNHRYVLRRMEHMPEEQLMEHNISWKNRRMAARFTGNESWEGFQSLVDPWRIVEKERNERKTDGLPVSNTIFRRNSYDPNERWKLNVNTLQARWQKTKVNKIKPL